MKQLAWKKFAGMLSVLALVLLVGANVFANYDGTRLKFYIYTPKSGHCKEAICATAAPVAQSIKLSNRSLNRYRCTGKVKVNVTSDGSTLLDTIRMDEFIEPNVKGFVIKKYQVGEVLDGLDVSGVDCTSI